MTPRKLDISKLDRDGIIGHLSVLIDYEQSLEKKIEFIESSKWADESGPLIISVQEADELSRAVTFPVPSFVSKGFIQKFEALINSELSYVKTTKSVLYNSLITKQNSV